MDLKIAKGGLLSKILNLTREKNQLVRIDLICWVSHVIFHEEYFTV